MSHVFWSWYFDFINFNILIYWKLSANHSELLRSYSLLFVIWSLLTTRNVKDPFIECIRFSKATLDFGKDILDFSTDLRIIYMRIAKRDREVRAPPPTPHWIWKMRMRLKMPDEFRNELEIVTDSGQLYVLIEGVRINYCGTISWYSVIPAPLFFTSS